MTDQDFIKKFQNRQYFHEHVEFLSTHLSKYFKDEEMVVFHEMLSLDFHLDVYFIKPKDRKYNLLLTSGMSLLAMSVDETIKDRNNYLFAELMVLLPKELEFEEVYTGKEKNCWIISMIKQTARFPHHYDTFISVGQTIQATEDMQAYHGDTEFVGCVFLPSVTFDTNFTTIPCGDSKINIYSLFPLYKDELEFKIKNGYKGLVDLLNKSKPKEIIDNNRKSLLRSKNIWQIFKK